MINFQIRLLIEDFNFATLSGNSRLFLKDGNQMCSTTIESFEFHTDQIKPTDEEKKLVSDTLKELMHKEFTEYFSVLQLQDKKKLNQLRKTNFVASNAYNNPKIFNCYLKYDNNNELYLNIGNCNIFVASRSGN